ncbi:MAG: hypothetical protein ACPGYI_05615, partial [Flavobacteriaceae bacterium]
MSLRFDVYEPKLPDASVRYYPGFLAKDVADAFKGKVTKSKLRSMTKKQLLDHAENDLGEKLDSSLT